LVITFNLNHSSLLQTAGNVESRYGGWQERTGKMMIVDMVINAHAACAVIVSVPLFTGRQPMGPMSQQGQQ
jgi:hypothetical protein